MYVFYGKSTGTLTAPAGSYSYKIKIVFTRLTNNGNQPAWVVPHEINSFSPNVNAPLIYNYNSENITIPAPPTNGTDNWTIDVHVDVYTMAGVKTSTDSEQRTFTTSY